MDRFFGGRSGSGRKGTAERPLGAGNRRTNRRLSSVRARVEHVLWIMKCQFGYRRVRYRGLVKNAAQVFTLIGLANLYRVRRQLTT